MRLLPFLLTFLAIGCCSAAAEPAVIVLRSDSAWRVVTQGFEKLSCVYQRDQGKSNILAKVSRLKNGSVRVRPLTSGQIESLPKNIRARCQKIAQPDPVGCTAVAKNSSVEAVPGKKISFELAFSGTCPTKPLATISEKPKRGSILNLSGTKVVYLPADDDGKDLFAFTVQAVWSQSRSRSKKTREAPKTKGLVTINVSLANASPPEEAKRCTPTLSSSSLALNAFGQAQLDLASVISVPEGCDKNKVRIVQKNSSSLGQGQWTGRVLSFSATSFQGNENLTLVACYEDSDVCSNEALLNLSVVTPLSCVPSGKATSLSMIENSTVAIELEDKSPCSGFSTAFEITSQPTRGQVFVNAGQALYTTSFGNGSDSFEFKPCLSPGGLCGNPARITLSINKADFSGRADSLQGYKDAISREEAAYLLNKVAFGGCRNLLNVAEQQGLRAMVNIMLDSPDGGCSYTLPISGDSANQDVNKFAFRMYHPAGGTPALEFNHWERGLYQTLLTVARYGSPLREYMTWIVLDNKLATNSYVPWSIVGKHHYNILSRNALGNFGDLFREFYGKMPVPPAPSQQTTPGVDPTLAKNPDYYQLTGESIYDYGGTNAAYGDRAHHTFLNNELNTVSGPNENLGRELLELYTMGAVDPITKHLNYTQVDVRASTYALAGYFHREKTVGSLWRQFLGWFPNRALAGINTAITIFTGTPWEKNAIFIPNYEGDDVTTVNYIPYLLNEVPATSRGVGSRLFTEIVHPKLTENLVNQMAGKLLTYYPSPNIWLGRSGNENYSIKEVLRSLLTSEAMFSDAAVGKGIRSPMEVLVGMMRTVDLPMKVFHTSLAFRDALIESQHVPLQPPNVFGWPNYGVNRQGIVLNGSDWLNVSPLVGTLRGIISLLNHVFLIDHESLDPYVLMPNGTQTSAAQLVDNMISLFRFSRISQVPGAKFSDLERQILIEYVQESTTAPGTWNPANGTLVRKKVGGLVVLLATHPAFLRK